MGDRTLTIITRPQRWGRGMTARRSRRKEMEEMGKDIRRKNRQTGTTIIVGRSEDWFESDPEVKWATYCEDHDRIVYHTTKRLALDHSADPAGWCDLCADLLAGREVTTD